MKQTYGRVARMPLQTAINLWLRWAANHYAGTTYTTYTRCLNNFADFFPSETPLESVSLEAVERYLMSLKIAKSTQNNHIVVIRAFFRTMNEWHGISNPVKSLRKFKVIHHRRFLTEEEYNILLSCATSREHALLQVLSNSGLRIGELLNVSRGDVRDGFLTVASKGRQRTIPLNNNAQTAIKYLLGDNMNISKSLKSRRNCVNITYRLAHRANIKKFSPHSLRRLWANRMRRHGVDILIVSKLMGHANILQTQTYLALFPSELKGCTDFMDKK